MSDLSLSGITVEQMAAFRIAYSKMDRSEKLLSIGGLFGIALGAMFVAHNNEQANREEDRKDIVIDGEDVKAKYDEQRCVICLESSRTILLQPCNHLCLCIGCSKEQLEIGESSCPVCREVVENFVKIFW